MKLIKHILKQKVLLAISISFFTMSDISGQVALGTSLEEKHMFIVDLIDNWEKEGMEFDIRKKINSTDWSRILADSVFNDKAFLLDNWSQSIALSDFLKLEELPKLRNQIQADFNTLKWPKKIWKSRYNGKKWTTNSAKLSYPIFDSTGSYAFVCEENLTSETVFVFRLKNGQWTNYCFYTLWVE
jgi:hypothetical protein